MAVICRWNLHVFVAFASLGWLACRDTQLCAEPWPGWRGPRGDGSSAEVDVPVSWDGATGKNVLWKAPIPGTGHSSPIVWRDRLFLVTCLEDEHHRSLLCLARKDGRILWQQNVVSAGLERKHKLNSYASGTPATDGRRVFATFLEKDDQSPTRGSMVVAAYDMAGKQLWLKRPGRFASIHGYCSSPVLFGSSVIINGDHDGAAYIVALNQETGETLWKIDRENRTRSYSTPIIREIGGRTQMILSGSKCIASYDPNNGKRHWIIDGPTEQFVASVVFNRQHGMLFMTAGFPDRHILGVRPTGTGNITDSHIAWRTTKACSYVPSPISIGDYFLVVADTGVASCFNAATGQRYWMERLGGHYSASLVSAGGLAYFLSDDGVMTVVKPGETRNVVAENRLGENCYASPAISDGQMFLRSERHLWCIEGGEKPASKESSPKTATSSKP